MRITGGELRGRRLKTCAVAAVRPTQDAVRAALFAMLAPRVPGCAFLDLFAGTGAVGIEAWSRGAAAVTWVEQHRTAGRMLAENVAALCGDVEGLRIVQADVFRWLRWAPPRRFDLVYLDPPYGDATADDRVAEVMRLLAERDHMAADGLLVAEQRTGLPLPDAQGWSRITARRYGHTRLALFAYRGRGAAAASANEAEADTTAASASVPASGTTNEGAPPCIVAASSSIPARSIR